MQQCLNTPLIGTTDKYRKYNESPKGKARLARRNETRKAQRAERERRIWKNAAKVLDNYGRYGGATLGEARKAVKIRKKDRPMMDVQSRVDPIVSLSKLFPDDEPYFATPYQSLEDFLASAEPDESLEDFLARIKTENERKLGSKDWSSWFTHEWYWKRSQEAIDEELEAQRKLKEKSPCGGAV